MKMVVATKNRHKLDEINAILGSRVSSFLSSYDFPDLPDVVEDGMTFVENATKKAVETAQFTKCWALADDSGLEVFALDGAPGVFSARYAGEPCDDARNNEKLLKELLGKEDRRAQFRTVLALSDPEGNVRIAEGVCTGTIALEPTGDGGFGYDPLFVPDGYDKSFAVLGSEIKNAISHRSNALKNAATLLDDLI